MTISTRALFRAVSIEGLSAPYNTAHLKIYYPAKFSDSDEECNSGVVPAYIDRAPFPIVIILPGINLGPEAYSWLAEDFARRGIVSITYSLIAEEMPGYISLTPGLDLAQITPENYGKKPSALAVGAILKDLATVQTRGVLAGLLDLNTLILGGHSAGGTTALINARADWFPGLKACFSYGAHTGAATALGFPEDYILPIPSSLPLMIVGGTRDGCIAGSSHRYAQNAKASATEKVARSFDEGISSQRHDAYLLLVEGANHFSLAHPADHTTGRPFIDMPTTRPDEEIRQLLARSFGLFIEAHACGKQPAKLELDELLKTNAALLVRSDRK